MMNLIFSVFISVEHWTPYSFKKHTKLWKKNTMHGLHFNPFNFQEF